MTMYQEFAKARVEPAGMTLLADLDAMLRTPGTTTATIAADLGLPEREVRAHYLAFKRLRSRQTALINSQLSLDVTVLIGKAVHQLRNSQVRAEDFIDSLIDAVQGLHVDKAKRVINEMLAEQNAPTRGKAHEVFHIARNTDSDGMVRFIGKMQPQTAAAMRAALQPEIEKLRKENPNLNHGQAAFEAVFRKHTTKPLAAETVTPMVIIPVDPNHSIEQGFIATAEGARIPIADAINLALTNTGWAAVTGLDEHGAYRLGAIYPIEHSGRFATSEQRLAQLIANLVCSHPDCNLPAAVCQMHHIKAWSRGGGTTDNNLAPACKVHNALNDDNPNRRKNGYIDVDELGFVGHRLRPDKPLRYQDHPLVQLGARMITYRHYQRLWPHA